MSDEALIKMCCQGGGEGAGLVDMGVAGAAGGDVGQRSTRQAGSRAQKLLTDGGRKNDY